MSDNRPAIAYLHGFGSGPGSTKARALAATFEAAGHPIDRLDLNRPSFAELTVTASLTAIDEWAATHADRRVALIGSSLGGYLAALWAEKNPTRADALLLLCPGLDLVSRWPELVGPRNMERWKTQGWLPLPDARGAPTLVHYEFIADAMTHPKEPRPLCPTLVIHGIHDRIVPIAASRAWVPTLPAAELIELDDGHELTKSLPQIERLALAHLIG